MTELPVLPEEPPSEMVHTGIRSLRELLDLVSGRSLAAQDSGEAGIAEHLPFPFMAIVGQIEMRLALLLPLINPAVSGVLLVGPRGTAKTTAIRSLLELLPDVTRSACFYGCLPEDVEEGGMDAVCPDCAKKYAEGKPLIKTDRVHLVELPLNAGLEDVIGGIDERAQVHARLRLKRGLLAQADRNLLYVDEVNLLNNDIIDAILDAAAQGSYTVRRGVHSASYNSRFVFIGSMNPEEGKLRPQIMDRFGLRVVVRGLTDPEQRMEAYQRVRTYLKNPHRLISEYGYETNLAREDIQKARELVNSVELTKEVAQMGIELIQRMQIDSLRAEITLFEAARALAAMEGRNEVSPEDIRAVAPMTLRLRRSNFMVEYFIQQGKEENQLTQILDETIPPTNKG